VGRLSATWQRCGPLHEEFAGYSEIAFDVVLPTGAYQVAVRGGTGSVALIPRAASASAPGPFSGRRSAARVQAGALRRGTGETICAALLYADLRDFTALSDATEPADRRPRRLVRPASPGRCTPSPARC
jgi:hypothetical protein